MTPLNLRTLFDPKFDTLAPRVFPAKGGSARVVGLNGRQSVNLPVRMHGRLAYLIGVVIGDGYLSKAIRRKSHGGGFHWKIVITRPLDYILELRKLFLGVFGVSGGLIQDKRKDDAWQLRFASLILHRFFARVIGLPQGRKTAHGSWSRLALVREFPMHFLAGLIDSDGYIGSGYIGIFQKRFRFLIRLRRFARETLGLHFRGPFVNNKKEGKITAWIISIHRKEERARYLRAVSHLNIGWRSGVGKTVITRGPRFRCGPVAQYGQRGRAARRSS